MADDGSWQLQFKQSDESSDYACDCHATLLDSRMHGSWVDTMGQAGSFTAAWEMSGIQAFREEAGWPHEWAASGHCLPSCVP